MRNIIFLTCFVLYFTSNANAQNVIKALREIPNHIGETIAFLSQPTDFDSREKYWYLYFGDRYPKQQFTVMVEKDGQKRIKLDIDIFLGRKMVEFTGKLITYHGEPDSSANPEIKKIKGEVEADKDFTIAGDPIRMHILYTPHTAPVDLKGKVVMIITDRKQIGHKKFPVKLRLY